MTDLAAPEIIAVIGGSGREGKGLAYRWLKAGHRIIIGSRSSEKAVTAARELGELTRRESSITGMTNLEAAQAAGIVLLAVPYEAHRAILESIAGQLVGKLLIDAVVPLVPGQVARAHMPPSGSAAQEARQVLGPAVEVAAAFHSISHELLLADEEIGCDVLVTGTSKSARLRTLALVATAGLHGWDAGALENSAVSEGLASVLIHINKTYASHHAGIRITGVDPT